ncbi:cell division protein FtsA [Blastomonas sp.]|uniref:cell division protein FtsA n=1 Tax=Blastomonas sp. TaxID=1909299 RepID=UPI0035944F55
MTDSKSRKAPAAAKPRIEATFGALDIGSSKIAALIVGRTETGELLVLGAGQRLSEGVKRGYITDLQATELAVREAVEQAERMAGINIDHVHVSCTSGGLSSTIARVEVDLGGGRIDEDDVDHLLVAGRETIQPGGRLVLHAQPALYTLDGATGVKKPIGLHAERLGVDIHVVFADGAPVRNIDQTVGAAYLGVRGIVASPIAAGTACLGEEERELGVALIEMGAAVTNISLYAGGMLVGLFTIPFGGSDITDAIASAFGLRRTEAERIKCFHGAATSSPRDNHDMIDLRLPDEDSKLVGTAARSADDKNSISRAQLVSVIRQPLDYLVGEVAKGLKALGFTGAQGQRIVLTGGCAELRGLADHMQVALGRTVRIGRPTGLVGLPDAHAGPAFSTLAGLVLFAANEPVDIRTVASSYQQVHKHSGAAVMQRLWRTFRANF